MTGNFDRRTEEVTGQCMRPPKIFISRLDSTFLNKVGYICHSNVMA